VVEDEGLGRGGCLEDISGSEVAVAQHGEGNLEVAGMTGELGLALEAGGDEDTPFLEKVPCSSASGAA